MKKIIIILLVIVFLGLATAGYLWFIGRDVETTGDQLPTGDTFPSSNSDVSLGTSTNTPGSSGGPSGITPTTPTTPDVPTQQGGEGEVLHKKISNGPVASNPRVFGSTKERTLSVRYVEKENGNVFEYRPNEKVPARISFTTIPRSQETYFSANGSQVLLRYFDEKGTLNNFLGVLAPVSTTTPTEKPLGGVIVTQPIYKLAPTTALTGFLYTVRTDSGDLGVYSGVFSKSDKRLLTLPTSEWTPSAPTKNTLYVQSFPSSGISGYLFTQNLSSSAGNINTIREALPPTLGMTSLVSPDGKFILYSTGKKDAVETFLYDVSKKESRPFPVNTLPEKCTWDIRQPTRIYCAGPETLPIGRYPDEWYKGGISFSDLLWEIDTQTNASGIMFVPTKDAGITLDITQLSVSPDGSYLIFVNKKDGSLWGFDLAKYNVY